MALTIQQLQANLDAVNQAHRKSHAEGALPGWARGDLPLDGRASKAKAEIEEDIRKASGQTGSRVRFAQHQRGDGPTGPTLDDRW